MTIEGEFSIWNVTATEDLTAATALYKACGINGTIVASTALALGVLRSKNVSGGQVSVVYAGITKVVAGAAVSTLGFPLTVTTSGFFIAATSGAGHVGRALSTAASGDLIAAMVDFKTKPAWAGT